MAGTHDSTGHGTHDWHGSSKLMNNSFNFIPRGKPRVIVIVIKFMEHYFVMVLCKHKISTELYCSYRFCMYDTLIQSENPTTS